MEQRCHQLMDSGRPIEFVNSSFLLYNGGILQQVGAVYLSRELKKT
ncbi:hypothetical protein ACIQD3_09015 [Peribacillus loiseleuriae]